MRIFVISAAVYWAIICRFWIYWRRCSWITENNKDDSIEVTSNSYILDGQEFVRVTRVLDIISKPYFYRWYAKHGLEWCNNYRDSRAVFGTRVHKEIQNILQDKPYWVDDDEMQDVLQVFKDEFLGIYDIEVLDLEFHLFNQEFGYAGTCDFLGVVDDKKIVIDWKTSKNVYSNYPLQVSAYLYAYEQMHGVSLDGAAVVCINDSGIKDKWFSRDECLRLFDFFVSARNLYRYVYGK
jgi:hypothetical protein